jgi:hypothetical protein
MILKSTFEPLSFREYYLDEKNRIKQYEKSPFFE